MSRPGHRTSRRRKPRRCRRRADGTERRVDIDASVEREKAMSTVEQVQGGCLCGAVRFTVTLPTLFCGHCHCSMCRRNHGAAYVTWIALPRAQLCIDSG